MMETVWVKPSNPLFSYIGRIDQENPDQPVFVYACSNVRFRLRGWHAAIMIENRHAYYENAIGIVVDNEYRGKVILHDGEHEQGESVTQYLLRTESASEELKDLRKRHSIDHVKVYDLSAYMDGEEHEFMIFKRMDACHYFTFCGLIATNEACSAIKSEAPARRIEVYGDSVSCGEVSEAVARCAMADPENHNGIYSNSFYSYPWILARRLGASLHNISQGGISLMDGEGYFNMPDTIGMLKCYDKIQYNPSLGEVKSWKFNEFCPHVVIVAVGQNDAHPVNYMSEDFEGYRSETWRKQYKSFVLLLREKYPHALILLTTTILEHDPAWDRAIDMVAREANDPKIVHFLYSQNGCGTCGHVRKTEAEKMAGELEAFLAKIGDEVWNDL